MSNLMLPVCEVVSAKSVTWSFKKLQEEIAKLKAEGKYSVVSLHIDNEFVNDLTKSQGLWKEKKVGKEKVSRLLGMRNNRNLKEKPTDNLVKSIESFGLLPVRCLIFNQDGNLQDGQHCSVALQRLVERGYTIDTSIPCILGLPDSYFDFVDQGTPRTAATYLESHNFNKERSKTYAACLKAARHLTRDESLKTGGRLLPIDVSQFLHAHPDFIGFLDVCLGKKSEKVPALQVEIEVENIEGKGTRKVDLFGKALEMLASLHVWLVAYWAASSIDADEWASPEIASKAKEFFTLCRNWQALPESHLVKRLCKYLSDNTLNVEEQYRLIAASWQAYVIGGKTTCNKVIAPSKEKPRIALPTVDEHDQPCWVGVDVPQDQEDSEEDFEG